MKNEIVWTEEQREIVNNSQDVFIRELKSFAQISVDPVGYEPEEWIKARRKFEAKLNTIRGISVKAKERMLSYSVETYLDITQTRWTTLMNSTRTGTNIFRQAFTKKEINYEKDKSNSN